VDVKGMLWIANTAIKTLDRGIEDSSNDPDQTGFLSAKKYILYFRFKSDNHTNRRHVLNGDPKMSQLRRKKK
jgi:hypothetical protein